MCDFLTKEEEKVLLRRKILELRNLAKHKQKRCFEKKKKGESGWLAANWKFIAPFSGAINLETTQLYGKQTKTFFFVLKAECSVF